MADQDVGVNELWQLCYHCLLGNTSAIQRCVENGVVGRFPKKDLLLVQCIANGKEEALKILLKNVEPEYFTIQQSIVSFVQSFI
jgi:hypothetical protein